MLTHLHIKNFTLVDQLDIELHKGLNVITGETGAGKSIMLDALGLTLGDRSDAAKVKDGAERCEVYASFDLSRSQYAKRWLAKNDIDEGDECILRRVVTKEGRSRAYINGQTVTLQQLRALGESLIDIHNQHEHQSLLNLGTHRRLLDEFGGASSLCEKVKNAFNDWQEVQNQLDDVKTRSEEIDARYQLLHYQVDELERLSIQEGEVAELEKQQRLLAEAETSELKCRSIVDICDSDGVGLKDRLQQAIKSLQELSEVPSELKEVENLLQSAFISVEEAQSDIERFLDSAEQDPEKLHEISQRLDAIYDIARKHRISPDALFDFHQGLAQELAGLNSGDAMLSELEALCAKTQEVYLNHANQLSTKRKDAAQKLAKAVNKHLKLLAMERAIFTIELKPINNNDASTIAPSRYGNEQIEFKIATNPGQAPQTLAKVASGGELSRISLAIQVATAQTSTTPTLVFDEVDVGIGGTTGDVVGDMLRKLGSKGQIFCVTHLAQVATKAHHHYRVEKFLQRDGATSSLSYLEGDEKIIEVSRMMGGKIDSKQSLDHAKQMLQAVAD